MSAVRAPVACALALALAIASSAAAAALPLQEVVQRSKGRVAHLSVRDARGQELGNGSGFVVSSDGKLATNYHVVHGARHIVAVFPGGKEIEVIGARALDRESDLAVLQLAPGTYTALALASTPAKQGDEIAVIGSPLGLGDAVSTGIVSAVRAQGAVTARGEGRPSWGLQISAPIAPGSSGSPILNGAAEVVGLAVGIVRGSPLYFGVPGDKLRGLLASGVGELRPLDELGPGRSVRTNLLISAAFLGAIALVWWLASWSPWRAVRRSKGRTASELIGPDA